jgi:hypothetical protein
MKKCTKCGIEKEPNEFHKRNDKKDGLASHCRACKSTHFAKFYLENAERINERQRRKRKEQPDVVKAWEVKYREANREFINRRSAEYRAANPEKRALTNARYREENKEAIARRVADWNARNPESRRIVRMNRRARIAESNGRLSVGLRRRLFALQKGKCACCGQPLGKDYHMDHIMPIALGGTNEDANIQLLRAECNLKKNRKHPVDYMRSKGFLL